MITINGTATGTVVKTAQKRINKKNEVYASYLLRFAIHDQGNNSDTPVDIYVIDKKTPEQDYGKLCEGAAVSVTGQLDLKFREDNLSYFLTSSSTSILDSLEGMQQGFSGTSVFTGHVQKKKEPALRRTDKSVFLTFSAYTSEKVDDGSENPVYKYIWIDFVKFFPKETPDADAMPSWLKSGSLLKASGSFSLDSFNGKIRFKCRISSLEEQLYSMSERPEQSAPF